MIKVVNLSRHFTITKKESGIVGSLKSFLHPQKELKKAVDNISFEIPQGQIVGFIGPNGAGKTTTLKCLSGLMYPTLGQISVLGFTPFARKHEFLRQISLIMGQKSQLWWDLPARETFLLHKEIYQVSDKSFKKNLDELIELLGVEKLMDVQVRKLSLGERMKMELITQLIHQPKILFLDEPTIGLDVVMQQKLRDFIREYNKKTNATILLTSHYMQDVQQLAERVIVIDHGKIISDGSLAELTHKFSPAKLITLTLEKPIDLAKLNSLGQVQEYEFPKLVLKVFRKDVKSKALLIIKTLPLIDISIEEPDIEQVIRDVFLESNFKH